MVKIVLAGVFSLFISISIFADECCRDTFILAYENYIGQNKELPSELFAFKPNLIKDSVFFEEKKMLEQPKTEQQIIGVLFDTLCRLDIINDWRIFRKIDITLTPDDYENFIEETKRKFKLYYIGEVMFNRNYRSFLILVIKGENAPYYVWKDLYLINISNNKCLSLTRFANYGNVDGDCSLIYTEKTDKNYFMQKDTVLSTDMIDLSQPEGYTEKASCIKFHYDEQGMLKID
ncbi:MAG: hypothetical protein PUB21_11170 [Bacteroidales bacterium]|nr:hypothetical protein [Bacteroidales bacterium]